MEKSVLPLADGEAPAWAKQLKRQMPHRTRLGDSRRHSTLRFHSEERPSEQPTTTSSEGSVPPQVIAWLHEGYHHANHKYLELDKGRQSIAVSGRRVPPRYAYSDSPIRPVQMRERMSAQTTAA